MYARSPGLAAPLFADFVATADIGTDPASATLYPGEEAAVADALACRRAEYTTVRWCARQALAQLGIQAQPILRGEAGAPRWPPGVVGSMTHCEGYRGAAVARATDAASLGLDAEPNLPLQSDVLAIVVHGDEHGMLRRLAVQRPDVHACRLLFSAKESVYKAWHPLTRRWLDFGQVEVTLHADGRFSAALPRDARTVQGHAFHAATGRWVVRDELLLTAVAVAPFPT